MGKRNFLLGMFQPQPDQFQTLLGQYYDPATARRKWLGGTLQGLGMGLASGEPGAWAQGMATGGGEAVDDYRQEALLGYRMQTEADDRAYSRSRDAKSDRRWQQQWDYNKSRDSKDDAWTNTQRQRQLDEWQRQDDQRAAADTAWDSLRSMPSTGIPVQNYGMADQLWQMGRQDEALGMLQPQVPGDSGAKSYAPIPYDMGNGQIGYGIPMEDGTFRPVQAPEGAQFLSPYEKAFQTNAGATRGKTVTEQQLSAPSDMAAADQALDIIRQIETSPYLDRGTGFSAYGNLVPGTGGYDFQNLVDQAKSGAFLTAIDQLRGMGALSNMEGQAATAAVTRINTATSKEAFLKALDDYRKIVEGARMRAAARTGGGQSQMPAPQTQPSPAPQQGGYDLDIGQIPEGTPVEGEDGQVYMKRNGRLWRQGANGWGAVQ